MGQRSRKRRSSRTEGTVPPVRTAPNGGRPKRRSSEERNAEIREQLEPLASGERPGAVTVAAIVAALLALSNIVLLAAGFELSDDQGGGPGGAILFAVVLLVAAAGMWRARYWAVLGFQALLGATIIFAFLGLLVAGNVLGALVALVVIGAAGFLFYKLIRAMARIQMPQRPGT